MGPHQGIEHTGEYALVERLRATGLFYAVHQLIPLRVQSKTYAKDSCLGARRMPDVLERRYGIKVGRKRVLRLKREMGLRTVYCHPRTSTPGREREGKHPYLLGKMRAIGVDEVWTSDITYLQIGSRNYYLCAVMDWSSRCVLGWALGADMGLPLCMRALDMALGSGRVPKVFNTD